MVRRIKREKEGLRKLMRKKLREIEKEGKKNDMEEVEKRWRRKELWMDIENEM